MITYRDLLKQEIRVKVHNQGRMNGKYWKHCNLVGEEQEMSWEGHRT